MGELNFTFAIAKNFTMSEAINFTFTIVETSPNDVVSNHPTL